MYNYHWQTISFHYKVLSRGLYIRIHEIPPSFSFFHADSSIREDEQIGHTSISSGNDQETEGELMGICGT